MTKEEYIHLLYNPDTLQANQAVELSNVIQQYPYLQSTRALYLKALYNTESYRYNTELKKTAAYTTDRSVLFDFITSEQFTTILQPVQSSYNDEETESETEVPVIITEQPETIDDKTAIPEEIYIQKSTKSSTEEENSTKPLLSETEQKLDIGKPLEFVKEEKHSFREWLQLSSLTPVNREEKPQDRQVPQEDQETNEEPEVTGQDEAKNKKLEIIDRFIEANPKISPVKNAPVITLNIERSTEDTSYLMTETLARVYLEQKKYQKAIQAYEILILKYPEKSIYFADLISDIKNIQQNNN